MRLAHHVVALLVLVELALLLGGRVLVLLVLGDEVVHVADVGADERADPAAHALADADPVVGTELCAIVYAVDGTDAQSVGDPDGLADAQSDWATVAEADEGADLGADLVPDGKAVAAAYRVSDWYAVEHAVGGAVPEADFLPDAGEHPRPFC